MWKNKLCKLLSLATVKRPVVWSSVAPVAFWYAWNASVASRSKVVPMVTCNSVHNAQDYKNGLQTCVDNACGVAKDALTISRTKPGQIQRVAI
jgi:hypothetical protein